MQLRIKRKTNTRYNNGTKLIVINLSETYHSGKNDSVKRPNQNLALKAKNRFIVDGNLSFICV